MTLRQIPELAPEPITSVVLKVAAGCNLNCGYCYEFNLGDESWRDKPASVSDETVKLLGMRIRDSAVANGIREFSVSLHGGEPMLVGARRIAQITGMLRETVGPATRLHFGMQTNATLLDDEEAAILRDANVYIGVSLDGLPEDNDRARLDKRGLGTHARTVNGIKAIQRVAPLHFAGILAVVDARADPALTFRHLASFEPPMLDLLLPHGNWDRLPPGKASTADVAYGRWLAAAFDEWFDGTSRAIHVRYFESIIAAMLGGHSTTEAIGPGPVTLVTIATDGGIEGVDTMKSVYPGAQNLGVSLAMASLDDVRRAEHVRMRQAGLMGLCETCVACPHASVCGGGYFPHRWGRGGGFANPSVYCEDIKVLIEHIRRRITQTARPDR